MEEGVLTLSWGSEEELLIGSNSLRLLQSNNDLALIWSRKLSRPVKFACFSPDASLVASTGIYDRLIKIWRRQSSGAEDTRFDFTYLSHSATVTALHWRKSNEHTQILDHVLYSVSTDSKVKIWVAADPHGVQILQLWAEIDMQECIQPRQTQLINQTNDRYAFIIDSFCFSRATEKLVQSASKGTQEENHSLEHIAEIAERGPEICVVLDGRGNMSAWGLEIVGPRAKTPANIFNIAHVENFRLSILSDFEKDEQNLQFLNFCTSEPGPAIAFLVHYFDGRITWLEGDVERVFDPRPRKDRLRTRAVWTGQDGPIKKIVRSGSGKALLSRTNDNEGLVWKQYFHHSELGLARRSSLSCSEHIHRTCLLAEGDFTVNLHHHGISVWDTSCPVALQVASAAFEIEGKLLCLLLLREPSQGSNLVHVAAITSRMQGIVWEIRLGTPSYQDRESKNLSCTTVTEFCFFDMELEDAVAFVLPVDPAGSPSITSSFLDPFAKDIAISYTSKGVICAWAAVVDLENCSVNWLVTSTVETGIDDPSLASGSSIRKTAIVDATRIGLTIWDVPTGQLEYDTHYGSQDLIQDLDWSSTPDSQSILAVGFPHKVLILSQMRFDYISAGPAWAPVREIFLKESTPHPIGDSTWLGNGKLVVGSGNQLYVYDEKLSRSDAFIVDFPIPVHSQRSLTIFDLVSYLNGPLPVFHPQFLTQCILAGKMIQVQKIIVGLHKALKFFGPGDELDSFVSLPIDGFYAKDQVSFMTPNFPTHF